MIYLATPYSHPEASIKLERFEAACLQAGRMIQAGLNVICPMVHSHPIATRLSLPGDWEMWGSLDKDILRRCDEVWVYMLYGWDKSEGVCKEIMFAEQEGIPIMYVNPENPYNARPRG